MTTRTVGDSEIMGKPNPKLRWQLSLQTTALVVLATGVWMTVAVNLHEISSLTRRIASARGVVRELVITNPKSYHAVETNPLWINEHQWEVYVPDARRRLLLATRDIRRDRKPEPLTASAVKSIPLPQGRNVISLINEQKGEGWRVTVESNGQSVMEVNEPPNWNSGHGSQGGSNLSISTEFKPDSPLVLFREVFFVSEGSNTWSSPPAGNGILLWIDQDRPTPPQKPAPKP